MKTLAKTIQTASTSPEAIYGLWADINHWTEHDEGIEWSRLNEPFGPGAHYTIKPKGGPKVRATILEAISPVRFVDVSHLFGAKLKFIHLIEPSGKKSRVSVTIELSGPLSGMWAMILGKNQQADLEASTKRLIQRAEAGS